MILELEERDGYTYTLLPSNRSKNTWRILQEHEYSGGKGLGMNGTHRQKGIFLMYGKNIPAMEVRDTQMWDITPTLLYALDVKIPSYMDGRVIIPTISDKDSLYTDAYEELFQQKERAHLNEGQNEELRRRLEKLGYL